jgi:hypothetical protein
MGVPYSSSSSSNSSSSSGCHSRTNHSLPVATSTSVPTQVLVAAFDGPTWTVFAGGQDFQQGGQDFHGGMGGGMGPPPMGMDPMMAGGWNPMMQGRSGAMDSASQGMCVAAHCAACFIQGVYAVCSMQGCAACVLTYDAVWCSALSLAIGCS